MQCPKCGTANPDDARVCNSCGCDLSRGSVTNPEAKTEISPKALLLHVVVLVIMFVPLCLLSVISTWVALLAMIWLTLRAVSTAVKFLKSDMRLRRKVLALIVLIISNFSVVAWLLFSLDAEPIPNDYTVADFRSAAPEYTESYELLKSLDGKGHNQRDGAPGIGLSRQNLDMIEPFSSVLKESDYSQIAEALAVNAEGISRAWENAKKGRDIINKLSTFPQIGDLTEPDMQAYIGFVANLKRSALLYQAHVCLQTEHGNSIAAVKDLIELDLVFRKLSVNARSMLTKWICIAGLTINIRTANFVANNPRSPRESLELLVEHFTPFTDEQLSWRNQIICEYLTFKNVMPSLPFIGRWPAVKNVPFFKRNSTLRMSRNWYNRMLGAWEGPNGNKREQLSVWPWLYPDLGPVAMDSYGKFPWYYRRYNRVGCVLLQMGMPAFGRAFSFRTRLKVEDELLQIVLNKRLGREVSLKATAFSDEYIVDIEKNVIFSPGPDGQLHTDDDIKLPINPEVLRWTD